MIPIELRKKGYKALVEALGSVDAIRFLQQFGSGSGDYTQERSQWLETVSREEFWQDIQHIRKRKMSGE
jgi:hypothetical protein